MSLIYKRYIANKDAAVTVDFVAVSLTLFLMIFFVVEMTLMYFFIQSEQKAAQIGARLAIVSDPVVAGLPATNQLVSGQLFGTSCNASPTPCTGFSRMTCTGAACEPVPFDRIFSRMRNFLGGDDAGNGLQPEHVTFSYAYEGLGYAGGPIIPSVTVRIDGVPHQTGVLGVLLGGANPLGNLPAVSVTLTGEDLSQSGG